MDASLLLIALGASLAAGLATGVGALPVLAIRELTDRSAGALLGLSAGVMLAAAVFGLLLPALGALAPDGAAAAAGGVVAALLAGAGLIEVLHRVMPHEHFDKGREGPATRRLAQVWLFVVAITLHNVPEGLAVGVGVGTGELSVGLPVTVGIALQNMPEGLVVAVSLVRAGYGRWKGLGIATLTGLVEPLVSLFGFAAVHLATVLLPYGLAFAAGAMLYVISHEIIPESHEPKRSEAATWGILLGFCGMLALDVLLG